MEQLKNIKWWNAACTRCLKTMCQTAIAMIGTSSCNLYGSYHKQYPEEKSGLIKNISKVNKI